MFIRWRTEPVVGYSLSHAAALAKSRRPRQRCPSRAVSITETYPTMDMRGQDFTLAILPLLKGDRKNVSLVTSSLMNLLHTLIRQKK